MTLVRHMSGIRGILCASPDTSSTWATLIPTHDPAHVTCPRCLAILARPAQENPCIELGEE